MNIFTCRKYHEIISSLLEENKKADVKVNFQAMAIATRIPKSYLSKVKSGKAHLNSDQMYLVCKYLSLSPDETRYMHLLLDYERCGLKERKDDLQAQIEGLQKAQLETANHLKSMHGPISKDDLVEYFLDPIHQIIHMILLIPELRQSSEKIAQLLGLSHDQILRILHKFEQFRIIERNAAGHIKLLVEFIHLPRTSPVFSPWRNLMRLHCLNRLNENKQEEDYSFSGTFTATWEAKKRIQATLIALLRDVEAMSEAEKPESVFQLNIDLFSWLKPASIPKDTSVHSSGVRGAAQKDSLHL